MSGKKRSDSSLAFRTQLKRDYVIVPEISSRVGIDRYVQIAMIAQEEAIKSSRRLEYSRVYIDLNKFLLLISKIATHPSYASRGDIKKWVKEQSEAAFTLLETTVASMDSLHDKLAEEALDRQLAEEFDFDAEASSNSAHCSTVVAVETVVETLPPHPEVVSDPPDTPIVTVPTEDPFAIFTNPISPPEPPRSQEFASNVNQVTSQSVTLSAEQEMTAQRRQKLANVFFVPEFEGQLPPMPTDTNSSMDSALPSVPSVTVTAPPPVVTVLSPSSALMPTVSISSTSNIPVCTQQQSKVLWRQFMSSSYFTAEDFAILHALYYHGTATGSMQHLTGSFYVPMPASQALDFYLSPNLCFPVVMDDFHASYSSFLQPYSLSAEVQASRAASESNRCFYLHLGVATQIHPFVLQFYFRQRAWQLLQLYKQHSHETVWYEDLLQSVLQYTGFVDANVLPFLWPREWHNFRICIISGHEKPIFSLFEGSISSVSKPATPMKEVLIHCNGAHFTLLRPRQFLSTTPHQQSHVPATPMHPQMIAQSSHKGTYVIHFPLTIYTNYVLINNFMMKLIDFVQDSKSSIACWRMHPRRG